MSWAGGAAACAALGLAYATAALLNRRFGPPPSAGRFATIDGLRGYLAFCVFLHHAWIWHGYARTGRWQVPDSALFTHFGQSSVALFFMITGFLFFTKLLNGRSRGVDWLQLYVSRLLRLVPLYLVAMLLLFGTVAVVTGGELHEPAMTLVKKAVRWLSFTILDSPPLNGFADTRLVLAGVAWSLPYEWFFYGALPLLGLCVGTRAGWPWLALSAAALVGLVLWQPLATDLWAFAGGIAAAFWVRSERLSRVSSGPAATVVLLTAMASAVWLFPTARDYTALALLALSFALVAGGNSLGGLLLRPASRTLGEMAYSIYLLHGFALFVVFRFVLGPERSAGLSVPAHWGVILALAPVVVALSYASFRLIEWPAMQATPRCTAWLRGRGLSRAGP